MKNKNKTNVFRDDLQTQTKHAPEQNVSCISSAVIYVNVTRFQCLYTMLETKYKFAVVT